jgi:hypothetical protein
MPNHFDLILKFPYLSIYIFFPFRVMSVPATIIYFTAYDQLKIMYGFKPGEKNIYSPVLSGITARGTIWDIWIQLSLYSWNGFNVYAVDTAYL